MEEEWRSVVGYEGCYEVSKTGIVKSLARNGKNGFPIKERLMSPAYDQDGYLLVTLTKDGVRRSGKVHRLVAMAFHGEPPPGRRLVNHKDGCKTNNQAENLEWVNPSENSAHAARSGLSPRGERIGRSKLTTDNVRSIRRMTNEGVGVTRIAQYLGLGISAVNHVRRGDCWTWLDK